MFCFLMASGDGFYLNYIYARYVDNDYVSLSQSIEREREREIKEDVCFARIIFFFCLVECEYRIHGIIYQIAFAYDLEWNRINWACSSVQLESIEKPRAHSFTHMAYRQMWKYKMKIRVLRSQYWRLSDFGFFEVTLLAHVVFFVVAPHIILNPVFGYRVFVYLIVFDIRCS